MPPTSGTQSNCVERLIPPSVRRADCAPLGQARTMTTPQSETPQPRDIALEQETPEQAAELEAQSDPDPGTDES